MSRNQQKPAKSTGRKWAAPAKKPYTSKAKEATVMALSVAGFSKSQIAGEVGLNRETVTRILSQNEYDSLVAELRSRVITQIGHDAVTKLHQAVKKGKLQLFCKPCSG